MNLPDRAGPLIGIFETFARSDQLAAFRESARKRLGVDPPEILDESTALELDSYALWSHRDEHGRSAMDHFLAREGARMAPEEREAYERFNDARFGYFRVEGVRRGESIDLRRVADNLRLRVIETQASQTATVGIGMIAHVVPYREHHEIVGWAQVLPEMATYHVQRSVKLGDAEATRVFKDPVALYGFTRKLRERPPPERGENPFEAEILADEVFAELGLPLRAHEVQQRFRTLNSPLELLREMQPLELGDKSQLDRLISALTALWNHTPRPELGERTPEEVERARGDHRPALADALAQDLLRTALARLGGPPDPDDEAATKAFADLREEWMKTPQEEFGGRTPAELLGAPTRSNSPAIPDENDLPPADSPSPDLLAVREFIANSREKPWAAAWAIRCAFDRGLADSIGLETIRRTFLEILHNDQSLRLAARAIRAMGLAPRSVQIDVASAVREKALDTKRRLDRAGLDQAAALEPGGLTDVDTALDGGDELTLEALGFLAQGDLRESTQFFRECADFQSPIVSFLALTNLARVGQSDAIRGFTDPNSPLQNADWVADPVLGGLVEGLPPNEFRQTVKQYLKLGTFSSRFKVLRAAILHALRADELFDRVQQALFPTAHHTGNSHGIHPEGRLALFFPSSDPIASERARAVISPDTRDLLLGLASKRSFRAAAEHLLRAIRASSSSLIANGIAVNESNAILTVCDVVARKRLYDRGNDASRSAAITLLATFLAWTIRGRAPFARRHRAVAAPLVDGAEILEHLRHDTDWLKFPDLLRAAELVPDDALARLSETTDERVRWNVRAVLAVKMPERWLLDALRSARAEKDLKSLSVAAAKRWGDRVVRLFAEWLCESTELTEIQLAVGAIATAGTRRGAALVEWYFQNWSQYQEEVLTFSDVIDPALQSGDRKLVESTLEKLRVDVLDCEFELAHAADSSDAKADVATLLELAGRDAREADAMIEELEERTRFVEDLEDDDYDEDEDFDEDDDYDDYDEDDDFDDDSDDLGDFGWMKDEIDFASLDAAFRRAALSEADPPPGRPFERESPRIGRNDPCPCGSGLKYKKCCGK